MISHVQQLEHDLITAALDVAKVGLCIFDHQGNIVMVNRLFSEKLNLKPEQLLHHNVSALSAHDLVINNLRDLVNINNEEIATEGRYQVADGEISIFLFQAKTLNYRDSHKYRVVSLIDITDFGITRDTYIELRRQLDALNSSIVLVDAHSERMPITYVNKRFEEMTGYSAADAIGKNCRFLQGDKHEQQGIKKLRSAIANAQSCHVVIENYKKDGSLFLNEIYVSPLFDRDGKLSMYIGVLQESTGRVAPFRNIAN